MEKDKQEALDQLYSLFGNFEKIRQNLELDKHSPNYNMAKVLDEVLLLRAEIEKLKIHNEKNS